eukprot:9011565-Heterocapsa_arctica.AAC.1
MPELSPEHATINQTKELRLGFISGLKSTPVVHQSQQAQTLPMKPSHQSWVCKLSREKLSRIRRALPIPL